MNDFIFETDSFDEWNSRLNVHGALIERSCDQHFFGSVQKKTTNLGLEFFIVKSTPQTITLDISDSLYILLNFSECNITCNNETLKINSNHVSLFDLSSSTVFDYPLARITKGILIPKKNLQIEGKIIPIGVIIDHIFEYGLINIITDMNINDDNLELKLTTILNLIQFYINTKRNITIHTRNITSRQKKLVNDAKKIMIEHISDVSLKFVSDKLFVSRSTLQAAFSAHNLSFIKALTDIRVETLKKELLTNESDKISTLCNNVGYSSISNAAKQFKIVTGLTFAEFKKKNKG
ncbi:hypothetical protein C0W59_21585 [Photobacterium kishitanii]|uniref:helix-turn-helix domain-containing protein n=1 Tax=Photobacterium kishitanii TaxID=318456 RepID=UPI000D15ACD8|nr:helix-turn-helix domain-containing protein [Photobacterium kishitanii]PSV10002.1 hypothetical protein C0W59_21585 [Photobacterium kishitanii]